MQLRYLQTLSSIAAENNSTIVFPVPIDIMSNMLNIGKQGKFWIYFHCHEIIDHFMFCLMIQISGDQLIGQKKNNSDAF